MLNTFWKAALSIVVLIVAMLVVSASIEMIFGTSRPGFVPLPVLLIVAPSFYLIWRRRIPAPDPRTPPRQMPTALREGLWLAGSAVVFIVFVLVVMASGAEQYWPEPWDWIAGVFFVFGVSTALRLVVWLKKGGAQSFAYWPEVVLIVGICLLAYGGSGVVSDRNDTSDRYLVTIGAGVALTGWFLQRHSRQTNDGRRTSGESVRDDRR